MFSDVLMQSKIIDSIVSYFFYNRRAWFHLLFCLRLLFILLDWNQRKRFLFSWWFFFLCFFFLFDFQLFLSSIVFLICIDITFTYYSLSLTITMRCDREKIVDEKMSCWARKYQIDCALCVFLKRWRKKWEFRILS